MRLVSTLLLAALVGVGLAGPALAHAHLKQATPAPGAVVKASPPDLRLTFSEGLEVKFSGVTLTGPDKARIDTQPPSLDPAHPTVLIVPLDGPLKPGRYEVDWHATATDTHRTQGRYGFTVAP